MERLDHDVEVLVVGGGTAGCVAAVAAARAGASTMLVDLAPQLGGTMTLGGVAFPGLFHAHGRQVIAGIGWDLVRRTVELDGGALPDFTVPGPHWHHQVRINGPLYAILAEVAAIEAGVRLCLYELPYRITPRDDGWLVEIAGKALTRRVACRQLIDCTGDADLVGMIGLPRRREADVMPGTLCFRLGGYNPEYLDPELVQARYVDALAKRLLEPGDVAGENRPFLDFLRRGGEAAHYVLGADSSTSAAWTETNARGRASVLRLLHFVRGLPGCEGVRLERMQPQTAVRETYRIIGEETCTIERYISGYHWPESICYAFYPVDQHTNAGVRPEPLTNDIVPTVPRGALIPAGAANLQVAGRCLSSDRLANSALRVQAVCMATGQAAGCAAALAAHTGTSPAAVPYERLCEALRAGGAIVP